MSWLEPNDQSGSGCGFQAVAICMTRLLVTDYSKKVFTEKTPHTSNFLKHGIDRCFNSDLVLISSRNLNKTWVTNKQIDHSALLNCNQGHIKALLELDKKHMSKLSEN